MYLSRIGEIIEELERYGVVAETRANTLDNTVTYVTKGGIEWTFPLKEYIKFKKPPLYEKYRLISSKDATILIEKETGKKVVVKRQKGERHDAEKAVLYALAKMHGIGASDIQKLIEHVQITVKK